MNLLVVGGEELAGDLVRILFRLHVLVSVASKPQELSREVCKKADLIVFDDDFYASQSSKRAQFLKILKKSKKDFIVVTSNKTLESILEFKSFGAKDTIIKPYSIREFIMRFNAVRLKMSRIACIGGGTGLFTLLLGIKNIPNTLVTSIVNMSDDGGSSGKLSQSFGILPPGDIRRSLVALSNAPEVMNQIIQYRFDKGGEFKGHSFGNIFLTVLAEVKGSMAEAVRALSDILNIQGIVLPASKTLSQIVARFENGVIIRGESKIDLCEGRKKELKITKLWHEPEPESDIDAFSAIIFSELVIIGPGDLYTSVITNLSLPNIRKAVLATRAKKIYICNLMTKPGETSGLDAFGHIREINKYLGQDALNYVLISNTMLSQESIHEYAKKHQEPVLAPAIQKLKKATKAKIIFSDIGNQTELVRHDSVKLKNEIEAILETLI